jgi:predicted Zn-dependent peptidase
VGAGLPPEWLTDHQRALAAVTVEEVQEAARKYLATPPLTTVVVGDAEKVTAALEALGPVVVAPGETPA